MKKVLSLLLVTVLLLCASCSGKPTLYILNWVDYINEDLLTEFQDEFNCTIKYIPTTSNEIMYSDILNGRTPFDIVVPSDYMIEKLMKEELLQEIDYTRLDNYSEDMFVEELTELMNADSTKSYKNYYVPYFWGSLGLMYSTKKDGVEEAVLENGFSVLFEQDLLPANSKVGMYDVSRDAFAAAQLYKGYSLNTTDENELKECRDLLKNTHFSKWDTDGLKTDVAAGNTDVALVYSGDFFDCYYADMELNKDITYGLYCPTDRNNVFFDALVIPTTSKQTDLAYEFINFMLSYEAAYSNAEFVGYAPTLKSVYEFILDDEDWADIVAIDAYHPAKIVNEAGLNAEVYADLGATYYNKIENYFVEVRN